MGNSSEQGIRGGSINPGAGLRRFCIIVFFAFIFPWLLLLGVLERLGWSLGETYTAPALVHAIEQDPGLTWMGVRVQAHARLKLAQAARIRPEVLIMGQSRVGQMRAAMFEPYSCYNLSRVSWPLDTFYDLLVHLPADCQPKLIIFSLDFFQFGRLHTQHYHELDMAPVYDSGISENLIQIHNVATQVLTHPQLLWRRTDYTGHLAAGISDILAGDAFRADGSERPPAAAMAAAGRSPEDLMRPTWKDFVTGGQKMDAAEMAAFEKFARAVKAKGIPMVAVQMPFYGPAWRMLSRDPDYRIIQDFQARVAQGYFRRMGVIFQDYSSFPPYSEDYRYFTDAVHPGEQLSALVVERLAQTPLLGAILPRIDTGKIQASLAAAANRPGKIMLYP